MPERKKLELVLNEPKRLKLLFDEPVSGESRYGSYNLYAVTDGKEDYSFFAPDEVHDHIQKLNKDDIFEVTKLAEQKGKKIVTTYEVKFSNKGSNGKSKSQKPVGTNNGSDSYYDILLGSYKDAMAIQDELNGMVDVNRVAITLFIARSKVNGSAIKGF